MIPTTFLDRLLNRDPSQGLLHDMERTLNERRAKLPEFGSIDPEDPEDLERLCRAIRRVLRGFDPRCRSIGVKADKARDGELLLAIELEIVAPSSEACVVVEAVHNAQHWSCRTKRRAK
jgi:predicted component of type VI protein secretion system